jgi:hypothetical protein
MAPVAASTDVPPAATGSEAPVIEAVSAVAETAAAPAEPIRSEPPTDVAPNPPPAPAVADLGPAPISVAATPVVATSGTSQAAAPAPAADAPAPQAAPVPDLTQLFAAAEAAIRRQTAGEPAAADAATPTDISPEMKQTFEAFWRSLHPAAASPEPDAATRALFERFMAERAQGAAGRGR